MVFPSVRASSGSRLGPSTTSATTRITMSSGIPMPNIGASVGKSLRGVNSRVRARLLSSAPMAAGTAVVLDAGMLAHDPGRGHPERPERLRVLLDRLGGARGLVHLGARPAREDELLLVHPASHVEHV